MTKTKHSVFNSYQVFVVAVLSLVLFTVVVDYMTLPALSAILLPELNITTEQFGFVVSAYAFSAGISALLSSGIADRYDRKKLLLVYYSGYLLGLILCALSFSLLTLIIARVLAGIFGGVVASICFAIVSDLFAVDQRGRVMGIVQMAFAAGQVIGLPAALYVATHFDWHLSFWSIITVGLLATGAIGFKMRPVTNHLTLVKQQTPWHHWFQVVRNVRYGKVFLNNMLLVLGDVMFMTFGSAFSTNNLGVDLEDLPLLYGASGVATLLLGPVIGYFSDRFGLFRVFLWGTVPAVLIVAVYSRLGITPFWVVVALHTVLFMGINARMITSSALGTVVPAAPDRGAFMAVDASFQQMAGGVGASIAGLIVMQSADGVMQHYPELGLVVIATMLTTVFLMHLIHKMVGRAAPDPAASAG